ncbi:DUF58 domain-containing protein [Candidatus Poribacteria bacterium]|nr:DUF58 domain-containing protein [Candidatus Poribacteria bacterium]
MSAAIPEEIFKKVRQIHIRTSHIVTDVLAGQYESVFKGQGIEFEDVREYQPGDDVRNIDWNVTARTGRPFIKKFVEERELTVMLMVDISGSQHFGTRTRPKDELAAELCAVIAFSAIANNDKVGLIVFTDRIEHFILPKKGRKHVLRVIRDVLFYASEERANDIKDRGTDICTALEYLNKVTTRRTVSFLVSDFMEKPGQDFESALRIANKRHDIIAVNISDPREKELPKIGIIELQDAETGETVILDTSSSYVREKYQKLSEERVEARNTLFRSAGVDSIDINTDKPYVNELLKFFRMRERRFG